MLMGVRRWGGRLRSGRARERLGVALLVIGSLLITSLLSWAVMARTEASLTVIRSGESGWTAIRQQLDQAGLSFEVIEPTQITAAELQETQVLFWPDPGSLSLTQLQTLSQWIDQQQGRLVLSGSLQLPSGLDDRIRQRLGAYWSEDLSTAAPIQVTPYTSSRWATAVTATAPRSGGRLVPTGPESRLVATWSGIPGEPFAVIATPRTVYLGWHWGEAQDQSDQLMDRQWLQAALEYVQQGLETDPQGTVGSTAGSTQGSLEAGADSFVAPALPLSALEVIAMRQELSSLVGRVESSLVLTKATQNDGSPRAYEAVIEGAKQVIQQLPTWAEQGEDQMAREAFAQARADLWQNYPVDGLTSLPEVRAIWLDRGTIVEAGSEAGLAQVFDRLAAAGINTVFFETINAGFPIYPSRIAPQQNPLTLHWDPLRAAVKLAHERQIELHAWMWTFAVGNKRHNILPEIRLPESYPGPVLTAHPEWASLDHRQRLFPGTQPETWLDPANPEARRYLLDLITEMVTEYGVDGIHLDYIRYPFQNAASRVTFGYGQAARAQFQQLTGVDPLEINANQDRSLWRQWTEFRTQQVNQFVAEVASTLEGLDPQVILSAAVYALPENERIQRLQQDWEVWIQAGDLDLLVPLTYAGNTRRLAQLVEPNLEIVSRSSVLFMPSVNLLDLPRVEFLDQMQVVRDLPTGGYALFAARHLRPELQSALGQSALSSTQIPYRNPFGAAQERFQVLQREWEFLLQEDEIRILEPYRSEWLAQVERVEQVMEDLIGNPGLTQVERAEQEVQALRRGFGEWMRFDSLQNPYRVSTWENRLFSLEMMLRYGKRVLPRLLAMSS